MEEKAGLGWKMARENWREIGGRRDRHGWGLEVGKGRRECASGEREEWEIWGLEDEGGRYIKYASGGRQRDERQGGRKIGVEQMGVCEGRKIGGMDRGSGIKVVAEVRKLRWCMWKAGVGRGRGRR